MIEHLALALQKHGFPELNQVQTVRRKLSLRKRPVAAIYVLAFSTGEYYVGQTVRLRQRIASHAKHNADLEWISYVNIRGSGPKLKRELLDAERRYIDAFYHSLSPLEIHTRGISRVPLVLEGTNLSRHVDQDSLQEWLADEELVLVEDAFATTLESNTRMDQRYASIATDLLFAEFKTVAREYLHRCLIKPRSTCQALWVASCRPRNNDQLWLRINVGWQTTLDAYRDIDGLRFAFYVSSALVMRHLSISDAAQRAQQGESIEFRSDEGNEVDFVIDVLPCSLTAGGADQVMLEVSGADDALQFLRNGDVIAMLRHFSAGLMQQGAAPSPRSHCAPLTADLLSGDYMAWYEESENAR